MKKLMVCWNVETPKYLMIICIVFSITGSSSIAIGRPVLKLLGITLDNFNPFIYYPLFVISSFVFYQVFLVLFGWGFGQFSFFWSLEKKMLRRFGISI
ncbi:DUF6787 family protein [Tenacibaculum halocynthiae]|uniref:DUF6787 family protein n=1 Tax=Tenacibaculum halocynthiae TaxID=1254437 RepID=UPI0038B54DCA